MTGLRYTRTQKGMDVLFTKLAKGEFQALNRMGADASKEVTMALECQAYCLAKGLPNMAIIIGERKCMGAIGCAGGVRFGTFTCAGHREVVTSFDEGMSLILSRPFTEAFRNLEALE